MTPTNSVSQWIASLKVQDAMAAQQLWDRYAKKLLEVARQQLGDAPKQLADEEDVVLSVFRSVCRGAAAGRFANVHKRDELWWTLLAITKRKVVDHVRQELAQKRGGGRVRSETVLRDATSGGYSLDWLIGEDPTPESALIMEEQHRRLLDLLRDDRLRYIAVARIEGYTVAEIAANLLVTTRTVERKLEMIRRKWAQELLIVNQC